MKRIKKILSIIILGCIFLTKAYSQNYNVSYTNVKAGIYNGLEKDAGILVGAEIGFIKNNNLFSIEYLYAQQIAYSYTARPIETFNQLNVFVCDRIVNDNFIFNYQIGVGLIGGKKKGELLEEAIPERPFELYREEDFFTVGIPVKFGLKYAPGDFLAIGLELQINLNYEKPLYMPMLCVEFW